MSTVKLFPLFIFILFSVNLFAQKGSVSGRVTDSETNQPLEYASIAVYNASDSSLINGTISKSSGIFKIEKIPDGTHFARVQFLGRVAKRFGTDIMFNQKKDKWDLSLGANYSRNDLAGFREGHLEIDDPANNRRSISPSTGERSYNRYYYAGGRLSLTKLTRTTFSPSVCLPGNATRSAMRTQHSIFHRRSV